MIVISIAFAAMIYFCAVFALITNSFRFSGLSEEIDSIIADVTGGSIDLIGSIVGAALTVVSAMIDVIADVAGNGILLWRNGRSCSA